MKKNQLELQEMDIQTADAYFEEGKELKKQAKYQDAIEVLEKAAALYLKWEKWERYLETEADIAGSYIMASQLEKALSLLSKQLEFALQKLGKHSPITAQFYNQIGFCYYSKGAYDQALQYHQKALKIRLKVSGELHPNIANSYSCKGNCYYQKGAYDQALRYQQKALKILLKALGELHPNTAHSYINVGFCYSSKGAYDQALPYHQKGLKILLKVLGELHPSTAHSYHSIGVCYGLKGAYDKALRCYQKGLKIRLEVLGELHPNTADSYNNIGICHGLKGAYDKALRYSQKALKIRLKVLGELHPNTALNYNNIGLCYKSKGVYDQALQYFQKAFHSSIKDYNNPDIYHNPALKDYSSAEYFLNTFKFKGGTFYQLYQQSHSLKDLQTAYQTLQSATRLLAQMRQSYKNEATQLLLAKNNGEVFENVIQTSLELSDLKNLPPDPSPEKKGGESVETTWREIAFAASEQSKALVLLSSFKELEAKTTAHIPADLLAKEKQLKIELNFLDKSIAQQQAKPNKDEALILDFQSQHFDCKQQYDELIEQFEADYPDYFQLKYDTQTATVQAVQAQLTAEQVMVSYFIGEQQYVIFSMTKDSFEVQTFDKPADFSITIQAFLATINEFDLPNYGTKAHQVYQWLIAPIAHHFSNQDTLKKLLIIPHEELCYLPFEALLVTAPPPLSESFTPYNDLDYLLHHCEISYHYSATLWHYLQTKAERPAPVETSAPSSSIEFAGFAPVYEKPNEQHQQVAQAYQQWATRSEALRNDGSWTPLPYSKAEVENIASLFEKNGYPFQTFLHESASKANFLNTVSQSRYLLIASHGLLNDEQPKLSGLVFYPSETVGNGQSAVGSEEETGEDGSEDFLLPDLADSTSLSYSINTNCILSLEDTYQLNLHAELVVLSSCESGIGQLAKGEGMMAVNRGFLYAGAKNVVYTLFKVLDKSSSDLTQALFQNILKEQGVGSALRQAKLNMVKQEGMTPKSWCGFVLVGS